MIRFLHSMDFSFASPPGDSSGPAKDGKRPWLSVSGRKRVELENEPDVASPEEVKAQVVDVVEVGQQTSQLLRYGVYISVFFAIFSIWSTSLTALSVLDQKPLWPGSKPRTVETTKIGERECDSGDAPSTINPAQTEATAPATDLSAESVLLTSDDFVSWQDLLLAVFIFLLTFVAARNIPGLLSLTVFSQSQSRAGWELSRSPLWYATSSF